MNNKILYFYLFPALGPVSGIIHGTANNDDKQKAFTLHLYIIT
jgi:hypothetical protein